MTSLKSLDDKFTDITNGLSKDIMKVYYFLLEKKVIDELPEQTAEIIETPKMYANMETIRDSAPIQIATAYANPKMYQTEEIRDPKTGKVISSKSSPVVEWDTQKGTFGSSDDDAWSSGDGLGGRKTRRTRKTRKTKKNRRYSRK
jgi:hypothetical protein